MKRSFFTRLCACVLAGITFAAVGLRGAVMVDIGAEESGAAGEFALELTAAFAASGGTLDVDFCKNGGDYYRLALDNTLNTARLFLVMGGSEKQLWTRSVELRGGESYKLRLNFADSVFTFHIDNTRTGDPDTFPKLEMPLTELSRGTLDVTPGDATVTVSGRREAAPVKKALAPGASYMNPLAEGADPDVMYYDGVYYLYTTCTNTSDNARVQVSTSTDLVNWKFQGPCYFKDPNTTMMNFWSPNVFYYDGLFYLVIAVHPEEKVAHRLYYAYSESPLGPFKHKDGVPKALHPDTHEIGGAPFVDDDGRVYLTMCRYAPGYAYEYIFVEEMRVRDGVITPIPSATPVIIRPDKTYETDEGSFPICEGGVFVKHNGKYYMIYASGYYAGHYGEAYAVADHPLGTYRKYEFNDILTYNGKVDGVGDAVIVPSPDGKELFFVYHSHYAVGTVEKRQTCIDRIRFEKDPYGGDDILTVYGPTLSPQPLPSGALAQPDDTPELFKKLPTVYLDNAQGSDAADGSMYTPFKTLTAAYEALAPKGGTVVLLRNAELYDFTDRAYLETPASVTGDIYIRGKTDGTRLYFKYMSLNQNTYFDHITLFTTTATPIIEARHHDLYMGRGVTTVSSSNLEPRYPMIVGGHYLYGTVNENADSANSPWLYYTVKYKPIASLNAAQDYKITILGGTWRSVRGGNLRAHGSAHVGTINGSMTLEIGGAARVVPYGNAGEAYFVSATGMSALGKDGRITLILSGGEICGPVYAVGRIGSRSSGSAGNYVLDGRIDIIALGAAFTDFAIERKLIKEGGIYFAQDPGAKAAGVTLYAGAREKAQASGFSNTKEITDVNSDGIVDLADAWLLVGGGQNGETTAEAPQTTVPPGSETVKPGSTELEPGSETAKPGGTEPSPGSETAKPGSTEPSPGSETVKPGSTEPSPGSETAKPGGTELAPGSETVKPGDTAVSGATGDRLMLRMLGGAAIAAAAAGAVIASAKKKKRK